MEVAETIYEGVRANCKTKQTKAYANRVSGGNKKEEESSFTKGSVNNFSDKCKSTHTDQSNS